MTDSAAPNGAARRSREEELAHEIRFIGALAKQDKGRLAALKRNAGNSLSEARGVSWFYGLLRGDAEPRYREAYFLVATLFASDKRAIDEILMERRCPFEGNLGETLGRLKAKPSTAASGTHPLDRRFNILLDADFDPAKGGELSFRLRQLSKLILSKKEPSVRIDWPQLLHDVKSWNGARKPVHKRWARSYYAPFDQEGNGGSEQAVA